jgi:hypothetical protein
VGFEAMSTKTLRISKSLYDRLMRAAKRRGEIVDDLAEEAIDDFLNRRA